MVNQAKIVLRLISSIFINKDFKEYWSHLKIESTVFLVEAHHGKININKNSTGENNG